MSASILNPQFFPRLPLLVAYSGGADSTALLHACWQRWGKQVAAVHIHHGLQDAADGFEKHCVQQCTNWDIPLFVHRLNARPQTGQSPEEAARTARYSAFEATVAANPHYQSIALAQHADDQVETLLLALSRGAGLAGLSAMPTERTRNGITYHRPLLHTPATALKDYLRTRNINWVEDPTNKNTRYTRNRIRHHILPALEQAFPQFRATFSRSSSHAAQAQILLTEIAEADLLETGNPPNIKALQQLSTARLSNVLRHWLYSNHHTQANNMQLQELIKQIRACTTRGHRIELKIGNGFIQRKQKHILFSRQDDTPQTITKIT